MCIGSGELCAKVLIGCHEKVRERAKDSDEGDCSHLREVYRKKIKSKDKDCTGRARQKGK